MVRGEKLRTCISSAIRWVKGVFRFEYGVMLVTFNKSRE